MKFLNVASDLAVGAKMRFIDIIIEDRRRKTRRSTRRAFDRWGCMKTNMMMTGNRGMSTDWQADSIGFDRHDGVDSYFWKEGVHHFRVESGNWSLQTRAILESRTPQIDCLLFLSILMLFQSISHTKLTLTLNPTLTLTLNPTLTLTLNLTLTLTLNLREWQKPNKWLSIYGGSILQVNPNTFSPSVQACSVFAL